jgi:predicted O-methyltransferase YrrM
MGLSGWVKKLPLLKGFFNERDWLRREVDRLKAYQTWRPPGHYYSPIADLKDVKRDHDRLFNRAVDEVPGIALRRGEQMKLLAELQPFYDEQLFAEAAAPERRYYFDNDWFRHADALALHMLMRRLKPRRIVEVGSGYSSSVMLDTRDRFPAGDLQLTFIDPETDRLQRLLKPQDRATSTIIADKVQNIAFSVFEALDANDILFIDSSHVSKIGSDVNFLFFDVLPRLKPGVYVHVHDVVYPFEYPEKWVYDGRAWNEAYLLRAFLMFNDRFEIVLDPSYLQLKEKTWLDAHMPLMTQSQAWSFWMKRNERA